MDRKRLLRNPLIWILAAILVYFTFSVLFDDTRGFKQEPTSVALAQIESGNVREALIEDKEQRLRLTLNQPVDGSTQIITQYPVGTSAQLLTALQAGPEQARVQHHRAPGVLPGHDADLPDPARPGAAHPVLDDEQRPGRREPRDELRQVARQAAQQGHAEDDVRRRGGRGRGGRGAVRDQGLPAEPGPLPGPGREDPQGRAALRPARHRQDAAGPGRRRRGGRAVLHDLRLGLRRDVRRRRRLPRARPVRAGQAERPLHHLRRRDRRGRPPARRRPGRRPRRARADAQPAARRDGRLRRPQQRHPHRRDEPARHPGPGAAAPGPLRPADPGRRAGPRRPPGDPRGALQGQAVRAGRRLRAAGQADGRDVRRRPGQRHQRGRAAHRPGERHADHRRRRSRSRSTAWSAGRGASRRSSPSRRRRSPPTTRAGTRWPRGRCRTSSRSTSSRSCRAGAPAGTRWSSPRTTRA